MTGDPHPGIPTVSECKNWPALERSECIVRTVAQILGGPLVLSAEDCRARREALKWKPGYLAKKARVTAAMVREFEGGAFYGGLFRAHLLNALREGERRERPHA
jgi:hypothetical protein